LWRLLFVVLQTQPRKERRAPAGNYASRRAHGNHQTPHIHPRIGAAARGRRAPGARRFPPRHRQRHLAARRRADRRRLRHQRARARDQHSIHAGWTARSGARQCRGQQHRQCLADLGAGGADQPADGRTADPAARHPRHDCGLWLASAAGARSDDQPRRRRLAPSRAAWLYRLHDCAEPQGQRTPASRVCCRVWRPTTSGAPNHHCRLGWLSLGWRC